MPAAGRESSCTAWKSSIDRGHIAQTGQLVATMNTRIRNKRLRQARRAAKRLDKHLALERLEDRWARATFSQFGVIDAWATLPAIPCSKVEHCASITRSPAWHRMRPWRSTSTPGKTVSRFRRRKPSTPPACSSGTCRWAGRRGICRWGPTTSRPPGGAGNDLLTLLAHGSTSGYTAMLLLDGSDGFDICIATHNVLVRNVERLIRV